MSDEETRVEAEEQAEPVENDYAPITPGSASQQPEEPVETGIDPRSRMGFAHYTGMSEENAVVAWKREALCTTCLCAPTCRYAVEIEGPMIAISRCLAYLPSS